MPFAPNNAGVTYQRAIQIIFGDMLHKKVASFVNDLVVKFKKRANPIQDLHLIFKWLRRFQLKMNPLKCVSGVTCGKLLHFIVHHRGIEIGQSNFRAIQDMPDHKNVCRLWGLQGPAYIRIFTANLVGGYHPFSHLVKNVAPFEWNELCRTAF